MFAATPCSRALAAVAVLALAALGACSGAGQLKPEVPAGVNLAGSWLLNRQASEDPRAMLTRIQRDAMRRIRAHPDEEDPDGVFTDGRDTDDRGATGRRSGRGSDQRGGSSSPDEGDRSTGPRSGGRERFMRNFSYARALESQLQGDGLTIEQSPDRLVLIRGDLRRSFTPGGQSVVSVAEGVADQHSGWSGREYVIEIRPQVGPRVIERYGLSTDGRQLVEKLTLTEDGLPKLEFTRVYDRSAAAPRGLPTSN